MSKPRLLDLFCGAGGCSMGYHRAGLFLQQPDFRLEFTYPKQQAFHVGMIEPGVFCFSVQFKVLDTIVGLYPINMMNLFRRNRR